jgi:hypothetical protein
LAALAAVALLTPARAEDDAKKESAPASVVKTTGKIVIVGSDGTVTEKTFGDGDVQGFFVDVKGGDVKGAKASPGKLTVIFPDGTKKEIDLGGPAADKSGKSPLKGVVSPKTIVVGPDGKKLVTGALGGALKLEGLDGQIRKAVEEALKNALKEGRGGKVDVESLQKSLKALHGIGPAVQLELGKAGGKAASVEQTLEKILSRLEKLERAVEELKRK